MSNDHELLLWCMYEVAAERLDRELPGAWDKHDSDAWVPLPSYRAQMVRRAEAAWRVVRMARAPMKRNSQAYRAAQRMGHTERERLLDSAGLGGDVDEIVAVARDAARRAMRR